MFFNTRREILYLQVTMYCFFLNYYIDTNEILDRFILISRTYHNQKMEGV